MTQKPIGIFKSVGGAHAGFAGSSPSPWTHYGVGGVVEAQLLRDEPAKHPVLVWEGRIAVKFTISALQTSLAVRDASAILCHPQNSPQVCAG